jgi:hypothetical protein
MLTTICATALVSFGGNPAFHFFQHAPDALSVGHEGVDHALGFMDQPHGGLKVFLSKNNRALLLSKAKAGQILGNTMAKRARAKLKNAVIIKS